MADRIRIYSRGGIGLADLRVTVERSLFINDEGEAEFDIVTNDANCRDDFLNFGNWLLIENDKLESWVGMIDTPQEWRRRYVHVHAFTPDRQFFYRNVPKQLRLSGKSGNVFREVVNLCNRAETTIIEAGTIWAGGADMPDENMSGDNLQDYIIDLAERSGAEYTFTPVAYQGKLSIQAHWLERIGVDSNFGLEESYNLADENYSLRRGTEPIFNELWGYGNGGGQSDRPSATFADPVSVSRYGLRQGSKTYSDYSNGGAVFNALRNEINTTKDPEDVFKLSAVDIGTTYQNVRLGNTHPLRMWSVGYGVNTFARVTGLYFNPFAGKLELINREVKDGVTG